MSKKSNNDSNLSFYNLKAEIARELGVELKNGGLGAISSENSRKIGGHIVNKAFLPKAGNSYPKIDNHS